MADNFDYREIATDDIDEMFSWGSGWDRRYLQLSPGPLSFKTRVTRVPGLLIEWNSFGQKVLFQEVMHTDCLFFGVMLNSSSAPTYRGRETSLGEALVYHPGREQEYVVQGGSNSLAMAVSPELFTSLGWELGPRSVHRIPLQRLQTLVRACQQLTQLAQAEASLPGEVPRDRALLALRGVLEPWMQNGGGISGAIDDTSKGFRLVKQAEDLMDKMGPGERLRVEALAAELEVPERTLYDAFHRWLGKGPYEYHLLRRMHAFREAMLARGGKRGAISAAANEAGFRHLGRLTQMYRRHFGESPRETIKRRRR